ncbi:hypothetical protein PGTUg99_021982 [Puccinia graminis f. sp. tritici]|uniref:Dyp-type peroxidase n=1 Tax=Puccinia graminis f. sp. tritici TaxID=56615 RepID=A0A5B0RTU7_PUCGR|nr:hypothetical protein PGTUg99_021982 [Puccinia graminis f. sp. tritici]
MFLFNLFKSQATQDATSSSLIDLSNVQGDVIIGLQKRCEAFWFCSLKTDPESIEGFRKKIKSDLLPIITTAQGVIDSQKKIDFSFSGIKKLGLKTEEIPTGRDGVFSKGQKVDAVENLGDPVDQATKKLKTWSNEFLDEVNSIDFVVLITAPDLKLLNQKLDQVRHAFGGHLSNSFVRQGSVRPGEQLGHEHFGFLDSISTPKIEGFNAQPEDEKAGIIQPGVILLGQPSSGGTSVGLDPNQAWLKDGSFMAFRELQQLVPEFQAFCDDSAKKNEELNASGDFIGARIVGRWKSGAPLSLAPNEDNPELRVAQNFDYLDELKQERCPYAAHIRKSNPRNGSQAGGDSQKTILPHLMIRNGIPYGPELTGEETDSKKTKENRGLLFVAYQSEIADGFQLVQKIWCNNPRFPAQPAANVSSGLDLLIGQISDGSPRTAQNIIPAVPGGNTDPNNTLTALQPFVVPLGLVHRSIIR